MAGSSFSTKLGLVMAAAGSAVGLGNIWKFPYIAGENGGAAFLVVYLICVLLLGLPLVMTEFLIGKHSGKSAYGAFKELNGTNRWQWLSWMCMLTAMLFIGFYFVVTGWCFNYLFEALTNVLHGAEMDSLSTHFTQVISNKPRMILFSLFPVLLTATVLWFGVNKGIEKLSMVLMPLLLVMMVLMAVRVLMLKDSAIGMQFFFQADFSKLNPQMVMKAMGQCFFSLSIGMGALITYGAYMPKNQSVSKTSMQVVILDTLVAILAGMIIFMLFPDQLMSIFESDADPVLTAAMTRIGVVAMRIISGSFILAAIGIILSTVFQAVGKGLYSMIMSICRQLLVLLPSAWLLARLTGGNVYAIWWCFPIAELVTLFICLGLYRKCNREMIEKL